jgi:cellulose synthase/poly-beta-1,6-N-acetylglucosamine synthase-like glycosyltransferase
MLLPSPPTDEQKLFYLKSSKGAFYVFAVFSSILLFSGMYTFTWANPELFVYGIFVTFQLFYLFVSYAIGIKGKNFDYEKHKAILAQNTERTCSVDVYLPICGEPLEILENTWNYVAKLDWPHLNIYILDDKPTPQTEELAQRFGFTRFVRDNRPHLKKAGNIRHAFQKTSGDFILILDADFCPRFDMISEMVPYMLHDPSIAIVQSPQFFEVKSQQTWVERGASYVQELFYRLIQVSRNTWDASICVGSCGLYRRKALEAQGGTYPIEHSEDLHTGFSMLQQNYRVRYFPVNLACGVCPDTLPSFWTQQYRWCTGSTSLMTNKMFWKQKLPIMARLAYLSGMLYYVATALGIFMAVIPAMVMVWMFPEKLLWFTAVFYTPSFLFGTIFMKKWTNAQGSIWDAMRVRQLSYYAHLWALKDRILRSTMPWIPTGAATASARFFASRHLLWAWSNVAMLVILCGAFYNMLGWWDYNFYPTIFFALVNHWINSTILRDQ